MPSVLSLPVLAAVIAIISSVPAFKAQAQEIRADTVTAGLQNPWALAFLPDGRFLVTERAGRLRLLAAYGKALATVTGLPEIAAGGQGACSMW